MNKMFKKYGISDSKSRGSRPTFPFSPRHQMNIIVEKLDQPKSDEKTLSARITF